MDLVTRNTAMIFRRVRTYATLFVSLTLVAVAYAQERSLPYIYERAMTNDAQLQAARAAFRAAQERLPQALAAMRPNINLRVNRSHNDLRRHQTPGFTQNPTSHSQYFSGSQSLVVQQPLFQRQLEAAELIALATIEEAQAQLESEERALAMRVATAYFDTLRTQDQVALSATDRLRAAEQLEAAKNAWLSGSGAQSDVDAASARLAISQVTEYKAQAALALAYQSLTILSQEPVSSVRLPPVEPDPHDFINSDWEQAIAQAQNNNAQVRALKARLKASQHVLTQSKAAHLPTVSAYGQVSHSRSDSVNSVGSNYRNRSVGIELNLPIYVGGQTSSAIREAQAQSEQALASLRAAQRELEIKLRQEHANLSSAAQQNNALNQALQAATRLLNGSQRLAETGYKSRIDITDAKRQQQQIQTELDQVRYKTNLSLLNWIMLTGGDIGGAIQQMN
jgi:outer membrane protein, protease secretion system